VLTLHSRFSLRGTEELGIRSLELVRYRSQFLIL
jgi:hypothetical protein